MKKTAILLAMLMAISTFWGFSASNTVASSPPSDGAATVVNTSPMMPERPTDAQIVSGLKSGKYVAVSLNSDKTIKAVPMTKKQWKPILEPYYIKEVKTGENVAIFQDSDNEIAVITAEKLKAIPKGTTYFEMATKLGITHNHYMTNVYQYDLPDGRMVFIPMDKSTVCNLSGAQLLARAVKPQPTLNDAKKDIHFAVIVSKPKVTAKGYSMLVLTPGGSLGTSFISSMPTTSLVFKDGKKAKTADLAFGTPIQITISGPVMESYPLQAKVKKVVILK